MTVYETEVPGVGKKFELDVGGGERLVILIHHDGTREVYRRPEADADSEKLFALSGQQARQFGSILEGAYFQPVELDATQVTLGDSLIEWLDVEAGSPLAGTTLGDAHLRQRTGTSIIAVQRDDQTVPNPGAGFTIEAGDLLVALGTRAQLRDLAALLASEGDGTVDGDA